MQIGGQYSFDEPLRRWFIRWQLIELSVIQLNGWPVVSEIKLLIMDARVLLGAAFVVNSAVFKLMLNRAFLHSARSRLGVITDRVLSGSEWRKEVNERSRYFFVSGRRVPSSTR